MRHAAIQIETVGCRGCYEVGPVAVNDVLVAGDLVECGIDARIKENRPAFFER